MVLLAGASQLAWDDSRVADRVEVTLQTSKSDRQQEVGGYRNQDKCNGRERTKGKNGKSYGAMEVVPDLLDFYPELGRSAPLMQTRTVNGWKFITRTVATKALRRMVSSLGGDPMQYALHSVRIRGTTQLAAASDIQIQRAAIQVTSFHGVHKEREGKGQTSC